MKNQLRTSPIMRSKLTLIKNLGGAFGLALTIVCLAGAQQSPVEGPVFRRKSNARE